MAEEEALLGSDAEMLGGSSDSFNSEEHDGAASCFARSFAAHRVG